MKINGIKCSEERIAGSMAAKNLIKYKQESSEHISIQIVLKQQCSNTFCVHSGWFS